jgi:hypothetical protein
MMEGSVLNWLKLIPPKELATHHVRVLPLLTSVQSVPESDLAPPTISSWTSHEETVPRNVLCPVSVYSSGTSGEDVVSREKENMKQEESIKTDRKTLRKIFSLCNECKYTTNGGSSEKLAQQF